MSFFLDVPVEVVGFGSSQKMVFQACYYCLQSQNLSKRKLMVGPLLAWLYTCCSKMTIEKRIAPDLDFPDCLDNGIKEAVLILNRHGFKTFCRVREVTVAPFVNQQLDSLEINT
jgi:hypothetical protein